MKNIFLILLCVMALSGCSSRCTIEGTIGDGNLNGKRIFLVPVFYEDSLGVDSVVIKDNKFRFERSEEYLADIRVDYHYRQNTENLLVVTEPGVVKVLIDSVSSGGGTPQNDSLQLWKNLLMQRNIELKRLSQEYTVCQKSGDTAKLAVTKQNMDDVISRFNSRTRQMAQNLKSGTLYEFLVQRLPKDK